MDKIDNIIRRIIREATADGTNSRGSYILPMQPGYRPWKDDQLGPYTQKVSKYYNPRLSVDSYDGTMDETKKQIAKLEKRSKKITDFIGKHPIATFSDGDGNSINPTFKDVAIVKQSEKLAPFTEKVPFNEWVEISNDVISEDLAVWFGTKKKPKGSTQPKGPWVNICKKVYGKHPPCGRSEATDKAYPKCRAAGVAGKMSDSEKKGACQQKRSAEKKDTQTGKGQKPIMTSYKTKKESVDSLIDSILSEIRNSY